MHKQVFTLAAAACLALTACNQTGGQTPSLEAMKNKKGAGKTRVLTAFASEQLTDIQGNGRIKFKKPKKLPVRSQALDTNKIDDPSDIQVGDYIVSSVSSVAPYGFMREVTGVSGSDDEITLSTTQATLEKVIEHSDLAEGEYNLQETVRPTSIVAAYEMNSSGTLSPQGLSDNHLAGFYNVPLPQQRLSPQYVFGKTFNKCIVDIPIPATMGTTKGETCFDLAFSVDVNANVGVKWVWFVPKPQLNRFSTIGRASLTSRVGINSSFQQTVIPAIDKEIARYVYSPIIFYVGPIPIIIVPDYKVGVNASGQVTGSMTYGGAMTFSGELGAIYDRSSGWSTVRNFNSSFSATNKPQLTANFDIYGGMYSSASITLYGLIGPEIDFKAGGGMSYDLINRKGDIYLKMNSNARMNINLLFVDLSRNFPLIDQKRSIGTF